MAEILFKMKTFLHSIIRLLCFIEIMITYYVSSLIINFLQVLVFVFLFKFPTLRHNIIVFFCNRWWNFSNFVVINFFKIKANFYGKCPKKSQNAYMIANHSVGVDFLSSMFVFEFSKIEPGRIIGLLKRALYFLPGIGLINVFQGGIFIDRDWKKDQSLIKRKVQISTNQSKPFAMAIFPEGTRFTSKKQKSSQKFSEENNLPILKNTLMPRAKGFQLILESVRSKIDYVYDFTLAYDPHPLFVRNLIFNSRPSNVHIHLDTVLIAEIPKDYEGAKKWLIEQFKKKDDLLEGFKKDKTFPQKINGIEPNKHIANFLFWTTTVAFCLKFCNLIGIKGSVLWLFLQGCILMNV